MCSLMVFVRAWSGGICMCAPACECVCSPGSRDRGLMCRFWDDWLRADEQRKGRACIRPEISRTHTFGEKGVSL